jgi:hypothetical protein
MKYSVRTNIQINNLKPLTNKSYDVTCSSVSGLTIRVFASGVKSFRYDRGKGYKPRTVTYGRSPQLSLTEARNLHEKTKQAHQDGTLYLLHAVPANTKELANHWFYNSVIYTRSRPEAVSQILNHDIFPIIGTIKPRSVTALQTCMLIFKPSNIYRGCARRLN